MLKDIFPTPAFSQDEESALTSYHINGFHVEYQFVDDKTCSELIQASQVLKNAKNGEYRPTLNPHLENATFLKVMRDPKLFMLIEKLIGGKVSGLQTQFFFGKPGTNGFSIHQDNFFVEAKPAEAFISTWLALTDVSKENGTLFIFPGAHKEGLLPVRKLSSTASIGQEYNASNEECIVPERYQSIAMEVPRGTLVFLHPFLPHGSYDNQSQTSWRYTMLNNYIKQSAPFRPGNSAKRREIIVYEDK